jgi:hypothetical protein
MKHLAVLITSFALLCAPGCTSNDRVGAGREGNLNTPNTPAATQGVPADSRTQATGRPDPAANGGSSLPASAPYQGGTAVTQNVNPAPFLTASQPEAGGNAAGAPSNALTSRADGTMRGPNDQPAASTGWGAPGQPSTTTKPAAPKQNRSRKRK